MRPFVERRWTQADFNSMTARQFLIFTYLIEHRMFDRLGVNWTTHVYVKWNPNEDLIIRYA